MRKTGPRKREGRKTKRKRGTKRKPKIQAKERVPTRLTAAILKGTTRKETYNPALIAPKRRLKERGARDRVWGVKECGLRSEICTRETPYHRQRDSARNLIAEASRNTCLPCLSQAHTEVHAECTASCTCPTFFCLFSSHAARSAKSVALLATRSSSTPLPLPTSTQNNSRPAQ